MIKNNYWKKKNILSEATFKNNSDRNFPMNKRMIQLISKLFKFILNLLFKVMYALF